MSAATATATARRAPSQRRTANPQRRRPRLQVVRRTKIFSAKRTTEMIAIGILVLSLLVIVVGHTMLAQGQIRLGALNTQLNKEQSIHSATVLKVAALETPARISSEAGSLHLVQPVQILQLPSVPLTQPLPTLKIAPVAAAK